MKLQEHCNRLRLGFSCLLGALLWLGLAETGFAKSKTKSAAGQEDPAAELFSKVQVLKIRIQMPKSSVDQLQKSYTNAVVYVPATIEEGGKVYEKVGVHLRGVSTFQTADEKPAWTFKFNEWVPGQHFHGLRKVRLSNCVIDRTYLQEFMAAEFFRAAGVASPRANFARVEFNDRDLGLYVLLEAVTKDFLQQNFHSVNGNLYEGDETDVDGTMEQDYGTRNKHQTDRQPLVLAAKEPNLERRFKELEKVMDMNVFISYMATEVLINSWDGYTLRVTNYRVFCDHDSGLFHFIPHGLDRTFEDASDPILPEMKGLVSRAIIETPEGKKRYLARMRELYNALLDKKAVNARLAEITSKIKPDLAEIGEDKAQNRALVVFQKRINSRIVSVGKQLAAEEASLNAGKK